MNDRWSRSFPSGLAVPALVPALVAALSTGCALKGDPCDVTWDHKAKVIEVSAFRDIAEGRLLGARALSLKSITNPRKKDLDRSVTIDAEGLTLLDASGAPVSTPWVTTLAELPEALLVEASAPGKVQVSVTVDECPASTVSMRAVAPQPIVGRTLDSGFVFRDAFAQGQALEVALDAASFPELDLETADAYVVAHRDRASWVADPTLVDVSGGPESVGLSDLTGTAIWDLPDGGVGVLGARYDVVLDVDRDGVLSQGDRLDQGAGVGVAVLSDFGVAGPHDVQSVNVSGGDWLGERIYYPEDIADLGARPLVVISHGNGHDYTWYDYLGEHFASYGFVVMAHQNETGPGIETASTTTLTNTDWFLTHLDTIDDGALVGHVDGAQILWMGHSRGGEGVVRAYTRLMEGDYVPEAYGAADIQMLVSIAPTVFNEVDVSNPYDVRYHLIAGSSDGDVTGGPDVAPTQYWRLLQADTGVTSSTYLYGVSHEDFNCCGYQDGIGPDQLTRTQAQDIARAYLLATVEDAFGDPYARLVLENDPLLLPATAFDSVALSTWKPVGASVIDDFQTESDPAVASSGAAVITDADHVVEGVLDDADADLVWTGDDPMNGMTQAAMPTDQGAGVVLDWESRAYFGYGFSASRDFSNARYLSLRACQGTRHPLTVDLGDALAFSVTLTDGAGVSVTRPAVGTVAPPYARTRLGTGEGWSNAYSTVRVPLQDFVVGNSGIDLSDVTEVRFEFGADGDAPEGRLGLDDIEVEL